MAVIRWNPFSLSSLLDDDFDIPTLPGLSRLGQGLNIYETENSIVAEMAMPGVLEDKIDISVEDNVVRVSGSSQSKEEKEGERRYFMTSMASTYNYSFRLPAGVVDETEPKAELEDGVLTLTFSKVKKAPPKKVQVVAKKKAKE